MAKYDTKSGSELSSVLGCIYTQPNELTHSLSVIL